MDAGGAGLSRDAMIDRTLGLPGTDKNFERSADRDLYWSMLLRFPRTTVYSRSCDPDSLPEQGSQIVCSLCNGRPMLVMEAVRGNINHKTTTYSEQWGIDAHAPVFVVSHNGAWEPEIGYHAESKEACLIAFQSRKRATSFVIQPRLPAGGLIVIGGEDAESQFIEWVESIMRRHVCQPK